MELLTERCLIRNLNIEDVDELYQALSDESVMRYIEPVFDMEKTKEFIQSAGMCEPPLVYAIVWKQSGSVIGHAIFHIYEQSDYEIGWILNRNYWGMGIADEVTKQLVEHARYLGADSCVIECDEEQVTSKRVALKYVFVYEGKSDNLERYRFAL